MAKLHESDKVVIYCRYITKKGKRIYPKSGKCFRIVIDKKKAA